MSVSIKYKGTEIASASTETTKTLKTSGKYCEADIIVENTPDGGDAPVINPLNVTANGTYTAPSGVDGYSPVTVNVPQGITPTGNINITDTNPTDVTNYATAQVVDADLVAENIKKNVNILGVVGSFEGGGGIVGKALTLVDTYEETRTTALNAKMSNVFIDYCNGNDATDNHLYIGNVKYPSGVSPAGYNVVFFVLWQLSEAEKNATNQQFTIYAHKRYGEAINLTPNQSNWLNAAGGQSATIPVGATVRVDKYTVNL